ncbi:hypothetical protein SAMN04490248_10166 [Salinihabitans flavidus]|uniref:DUF1127 domain-containing protein n=1 Tax=Salinihabitans flavidus TaxID=569882 RepID=A0A1H8LAW1_9RHOB|nr:hypothetical protein [Salinihabitans flavidus]SEO02310.1 hypothetical protein SAMN04490248_10166 [Salinihabitans flavidus]
MQRQDPSITFTQHSILKALDLFVVRQGMGFNPYLRSRERLHEAVALDSMSDADLAAMGLRREDIPAFVFSDLLT